MMTFALGSRSVLARRGSSARSRAVYRPHRRATLPKRSAALRSFFAPRPRFVSPFIAYAGEDDNEEGFSGDWPMNWSLASYEVRTILINGRSKSSF